MRNIKLRFLALANLMVFFTIFGMAQRPSKKILILHSYNQGLSWTDKLNQALISEIKQDTTFTANFDIEYLDTKRYIAPEYLDIFTQYFKTKFESTRFDVVITTDNAAFNFMVTHRDELPGKPPVVFCGLNYVDSIPPNFTGIMEDIDIYSNIKTILSIHPDYEKLYLIIDHTLTGKVLLNKAIETIGQSFPDLKHEYLSNLTYPELLNKLRFLKKGEIVLLLTFNTDKERNVISYDQIMDDIKPICKVPIYGTWDFYLDRGIVGGKITYSTTHGKAAANIALRILKGEQTGRILVKPGPTLYLFDQKVLREFRISHSRLPKDSKIINTPLNYMEENMALISFVGVVLVLLLVIIGFLIKIVSKEKHISRQEHTFNAELKQKSIDLEKALQQAEQSSQLKSAFLTNLSHEIRTPMNAIVGFSDLMSSNKDEIKNQEYISIIKSSSSQLLSIINDILEMSLIETKQSKIHLSEVNINQIFDDLFYSFTLSANNSEKVVLTKNLPLSKKNADFVTDEVKFKQILSNLISNALKFTELGYVEIGYQPRKDVVEFYVKDSGVGIAPEHHEEIFKRFRKIDSELPLTRGLGIGLSLSKSFVQLLGGEIWLESKVGEGSTFFFTLPYTKSTAKTEKETVEERPVLYDMTILVCEDDPFNILYFKELFKNNESSIFWAKNGKEAIQICSENQSIDLVLMDLKMPEMNGWEATKIIKSMRPDLPVIAQTAHLLPSETKEISGKGFDDYLTKPINKRELFEKINKFRNNQSNSSF